MPEQDFETSLKPLLEKLCVCLKYMKFLCKFNQFSYWFLMITRKIEEI